MTEDESGVATRNFRVGFFIIGVQKGGTTALFGSLSQHPDVLAPSRKETHFFDDEAAPWPPPDYSALHGFFPDREARTADAIAGEATPVTIYWPQALSRLNAYNPDAKLIALLRHPTRRAYSHWRMERARGLETLAFADAISPAGRARAAGRAHRVFSYVERGLYAGQIRRLLSLFPRERVLFLRTDALWSAPAATLGETLGFLGLTPVAPARSGYVSPYPRTRDDGLPRDAGAMLDRLYRPDIEETAALTGLDLSDWLDTDYVEPMAPPG